MLISSALAWPVVFMVIGILLLIKGGGFTINSSVYIARRFGLSPMVVGFTILAFGTSLPELIVSILAVLRGSEGIAMGNVIGSNIANILLVIGVTALFVSFQVHVTKSFMRDIVVMILASLMLLGLMFYGDISRIAGAWMIFVLAAYVFIQYKMANSGGDCIEDLEAEVREQEEETAFSSPAMPYVYLFAGLVGVSVGAEFLVRGASSSAQIIGVPEAVVALSIIAFGTSLPELSTSIIAGRKGHTDMVLGNIIGSNVFNILMILGVTALVKPIMAASYAPQLLGFDIWVMLFVSFIFAMILVLYGKIGKLTGILFICAYVAYNIYIYAMSLGS